MESLAHAVVAAAFALLGGTQHVDARVSVTHPQARTAHVMIIQKVRGTPTTVRRYDADMTQLMHIVAISTDFTQFLHVHPTYDQETGAFNQDLPVDPAKSYYVYADSTPTGMGQQVMRFEITSKTRAASPVIRSASAKSVEAGPDRVSLDATTIAAGKPLNLGIEITTNGKPTSGLVPYLGAAGHAVFINTSTLEYAHVHPTLRGQEDMDDMGNMSHMNMDVAGPHLVLHIPSLPAGTYKLWFQFRDAAALRVAPFTIIATKNNKVASSTIVAPLELRKK